MLAAVHGDCRPDFLIYANRLFDRQRVFDGVQGVAYGGPDLSDRNLRLLSGWAPARTAARFPGKPWRFPVRAISARDGSPSSTPCAAASASRFTPCSSFPRRSTRCARGSKIEPALHRLYFDPADGLIIWIHHAAARLGLLHADGSVRFLDLARRGQESCLDVGDLDPAAA